MSVAPSFDRVSVGGQSIAATSHPLATLAAMQMYAAGGNAVDAAVAAAITLTVVEPTGCGLGGDAFAIVSDGHGLHGLDASGRSPSAWSREMFAGLREMPQRGWGSVTVPGAVSGWVALSQRFGRLAFEELFQPAIRHATDGYRVSPRVAARWQREAGGLAGQPGFAETFLPSGVAPRSGERFTCDSMARTLASIAQSEGNSFYRGEIARSIVDHASRYGGAISESDLATHSAHWRIPLPQRFGKVVLEELPPSGQGIAALMAIGILDRLTFPDGDASNPQVMHLAIEATKLALADLYHHVGDPDHMSLTSADLLASAYLDSRAQLVDPERAGDPGHGDPPPGGTVCLATADPGGTMVSLIQSNYMGFGSGIVVPGTGVSLHNRGAGFSLSPGHPNVVGPRKRPLHTIIPGLTTDSMGHPLMAFGVMGGPMQAQGHVQMVLRVHRFHEDPQCAVDAPRWRVLSGRSVVVEPSMPATTVRGLHALGHDVVVSSDQDHFEFGGAQLIVRSDKGYLAGSDRRKDGCALAW